MQYKTEQYAVLAVARGCWQLQRRVVLWCGSRGWQVSAEAMAVL